MEADGNSLKLTVKELLSNLALRMESISSQYYEEADTADDRLVFLIEDLMTLTEGINALQGKDALPVELSELQDKLNMLYGAMESGDSLLMADILKHEIKPLLEYWDSRIEIH